MNNTKYTAERILNKVSWKSGLTGELITLEDNLNQLYSIAGLNTSKVLSKNSTDEGEDLNPYEKLNDSNQDFENIINEHLLKINEAAQHICALISIQSDFDLPIPLFVLLKLSSKIGLIRWKDYKKKPNGLLKNYVYSLTPCLIEINLLMFKSIITVLGTNIIPFIEFINRTLLRILDWTRSSNLLKHDENIYHTVRSHVFRMISFIGEQLSLNMNLEPQQLKVLLTTELVDSLDEMLTSSTECTLLRDEHLVEALRCLENLLIIYADLLESTLECKLKRLIIQTCLRIYRDFSSNTTSLMCRKQLLQLLQTLANQPYATSTTEISYHIFEMAEKFESDPEMRSLIRRTLKIGLAHRPTIVSHYDVYNCYGRPMLVASMEEEEDLSTSLTSQSIPNVAVDDTQPALPQPSPQQQVSIEPGPPQPAVLSEPPRPQAAITTPESQMAPEQPAVGAEDRDVAGSPDSDIMILEQSEATGPAGAKPAVGVAGGRDEEQQKQEAGKEDSEIVSYMSFFVEKLA